MLCAWARRNSDQPGPRRRGAGPRPELRDDGRDRRRGDTDPELEQLTLDAHIAPPRVLTRQPPDQAARLSAKRGTARPAAAASSTSLKQSSMAAAKRLRADRKAGPPLSREQPAHRSEQRPVGGRVARPPPSTREDRQLVAQHDDLKLPLTATMGEHANNPAQKPVQQPPQHHAQSEPARPRSPARPRPGQIEFLYPTRSSAGSISLPPTNAGRSLGLTGACAAGPPPPRHTRERLADRSEVGDLRLVERHLLLDPGAEHGADNAKVLDDQPSTRVQPLEIVARAHTRQLRQLSPQEEATQLAAVRLKQDRLDPSISPCC